VVFGGIYGGKFTPTEGAAVGAAATFVAALAKREMTWDKFKRSASMPRPRLGDDLHDLPRRRPDERGAGADPGAGAAGRPGQGWGLPPLVVSAILLFYLMLGAVMDELSMILLTIPIFFPMIMGWTSACPRKRGHLVRHPGADDGRLRPAGAAGGAERLRRQRHGARMCRSPRATAA
jgi:C4-dicarboxylate transporter DctM subunit